MPVFVPPVVADVPWTNAESSPTARRLFKRYGPLDRGRSVIGTRQTLAYEGSFEAAADVAGWQAAAGTPTLSHGVGTGAHGVGFLVVTSIGDSVSAVRKTNANLVAATAGTTYSVIASIRPATVARQIGVGLNFYDAALTLLLQAKLITTPAAVGVWGAFAHTVAAPANTAFLSPYVEITSAPNGEAHHVDKVLAAAGTSVAWPVEPALYRTVDSPDQATLATATEVYLGGHQYIVSDTVGAALTAAGYVVT